MSTGRPASVRCFWGGVLVLSREAGRLDKCFSDCLRPNANEMHAVGLDDLYLQGLLQRFWDAVPRDSLVMINQKIVPRAARGAVTRRCCMPKR